MDSGKQYIGSTVNFHRRYVFHLYYLARNKHHSPTMQNSYNKYGEMSFEHTILELVQPENLKAREQAWIDLLRPVFNVAQHVERSVLGIKFGPAPAERGLWSLLPTGDPGVEVESLAPFRAPPDAGRPSRKLPRTRQTRAG